MQEIKTFTDYKLSLMDRILDTAMKAFAERGVKAVKMDDIATSLSISKRTLYEIYDTKEQVLFEGLKRYHRIKGEQMAAFAQDPSHDVLDIVIYLYRYNIQETVRLTPAFYEEVKRYQRIADYVSEQRQQNLSCLMDFLRRGVAEGFFRSEVDYAIIAHLFEAIGDYMVRARLYEQYSFEQIFFNMLFVTLRGFCTPKGIEKLDRFFSEIKL